MSAERARVVFALVAGLLFGYGLALSGMVNPSKVLGFLDLFGRWDPTLAVVMGGALAVTLPGFRWVLARPQPWVAPRFALPQKQEVDRRLLAGATLFGIGWGLAGFCPGPALAALVSGNVLVYVFVAAMVAGFLLHEFIDALAAKRASRAPQGLRE